MDNFNEKDNFHHRQIIVKSLVELAPHLSAQQVHDFDTRVCEAFDIDQEEHPPLFLDSFSLG